MVRITITFGKVRITIYIKKYSPGLQSEAIILIPIG